MGYTIKIVEGHDPSSYFWFKPVIVKSSGKILWNDVIELDEVFSIEENDVDCFLAYFFFKYFDKNLSYNKRRFEDGVGYIERFEWYLTHNFYTYEVLEKMVNEILSVAELLESDYNNPSLSKIKERYSIYYMCSRDDIDFVNNDNSAISKHISVVIDFYKRFAKRLTLMMKNNPETTLISIMGP